MEQDFALPTLEWATFVVPLAWSEFVQSVIWDSYIMRLAWESFVTILEWGSHIPELSWGNYISSVDWGRYIPTAPISQTRPVVRTTTGGQSDEVTAAGTLLTRQSLRHGSSPSTSMCERLGSELDIEVLAAQLAKRFQQKMR